MGRPIKSGKRLLSANVTDEARALLETKAEQTKSTMSDVLDKLIKKAFSPKRGLASRVAKAKADADVLLEQEQFSINASLASFSASIAIQLSAAEADAEAKLSNARAEAESKLSAAKADADAKLSHAKYSAQDAIRAAEKEWADSLQAMLVSASERNWLSKEHYLQHVSRWLFDRRVLAVQDRFDRWRVGVGLGGAMLTYMQSGMLPDKLQAADLAAESPTIELSEEVFDYMLASLYAGDADEFFSEYCKQDTTLIKLGESVSHTGFLDKLKATSLLFASARELIAVHQANQDLSPSKVLRWDDKLQDYA